MTRGLVAAVLMLTVAGLEGCSAGTGGGSDEADGKGSSAGPSSGAGSGLFGEGGTGSSGSGGGDGTCASATAVAEVQQAPADIIWVVDQSGSMNQETDYVQQKLNDFAGLIEMSGVDYHVVMIADPDSGNAICVPPPLAGPNCGDGPRFRLVAQEVDSHDGPQLAVELYPQYSDFLRPDATKHFVFVTDDDSDLSAAEFTQQVMALQPAGMFDGFKVHGIYAFGSGNNGCDGPFGSGASDGTVYTQLVAQTMGAAGVICTGDWTTVFTEITQAVLAGSKVPCDMDIPDPPDGQTLDPNLVNVRYQSGTGPDNAIGRVNSAADCGAAGGWYYDDNKAPTKISLCPSTCETVQKDAAAKLQIEFGCQSVFQPT